MFQDTVLNINKRDYSKAEVEDWASCGNDLTAALRELANHLANVVIEEQDYAVLLRYFSFGLNRLKSHRVQFEQGEKCLVIAY